MWSGILLETTVGGLKLKQKVSLGGEGEADDEEELALEMEDILGGLGIGIGPWGASDAAVLIIL